MVAVMLAHTQQLSLGQVFVNTVNLLLQSQDASKRVEMKKNLL